VIVNEIIVDQVLTPFELIESQELKLELDWKFLSSMIPTKKRTLP
jgi:hypothetical protein